MLTRTQHQALAFIRRFIQRHGHAPSLAEIGAALGIRSRGSVHRHVRALAEDGRIRLQPGRKRGIELVEAADESDAALTLPLLGRIAAGQPIEAIPGEESINLADFLMGPDCFALRVQGDSMMEAGILDGDTVIVKRRERADNGAIVVALIAGQDATLKRIRYRADGRVELIPANARLQTLVYAAEQVAIQGIVVGQLRSYR